MHFGRRMTTRLALFGLLALTTTASAETFDAARPAAPTDGYVGAGVTAGSQRALVGGLHLEGGLRVRASIYAHAQLTAGNSGSSRGSLRQYRAGAEARHCTGRNLLCAFAGADAGYQHDAVVDALWFSGRGTEPFMTDAHDLLLVPRAGVEAGRHIRFRLTMETPMFHRVDGESARASGVGLALALGAGYAF